MEKVIIEMKDLSTSQEIRKEMISKKFTGEITFKYPEYVYTEYQFNGKVHRIDGPARIRTGSHPFRELYLHDLYYSNVEMWFEELSEEEKLQALFNINEWRALKLPF